MYLTLYNTIIKITKDILQQISQKINTILYWITQPVSVKTWIYCHPIIIKPVSGQILIRFDPIFRNYIIPYQRMYDNKIKRLVLHGILIQFLGNLHLVSEQILNSLFSESHKSASLNKSLLHIIDMKIN